MKLENIDSLHHLLPSAEQELIRRPPEPKKARRIRTERKISAHRPDGSAITNTEAYRLHRIIEVLQAILVKPQADLIPTRIDVSQVVKQHAADVIADQWKSQFHRVGKKRPAPDRK